MLLNKRPPALPRINVEFRRKNKKQNSLKFQVKQTAVLLVEVVVN
jgi:hypothetical protein